jgi:formamidopyrimidine-DNA glycosylase
MPELPEVETTCRGISPLISGKTIQGATVRQAKLRWPVPDLPALLTGCKVHSVQRRAKYLLFNCGTGHLLIHLGMSGSLRVLPRNTPAQKHDHIDIQFAQHCLRLRDPRRFGAVLWIQAAPEEHALLKHLGPEPFSNAFNADYLWQRAQQRKVAIKNLLMDGKIVVGVGNIYATEALFMAGIHPNRASNRISKARLGELVDAVKHILRKAIKKGGTTLRDFQREDGKPGYFRHQLQVYGRTGEPCLVCGKTIKHMTIGQRSSAYCGHCQH